MLLAESGSRSTNLRFPRIDEVQPQPVEVLGIACHQRHVVLQGSGRQQAVDSWQGAPRITLQTSPAVCHWRINAQNAPQKKRGQFHMQPFQKDLATFGIFQPLNALADFTQGEHAQKK